VAKYQVVHYINQFFAGIGGEDKAGLAPEQRAGIVGPGMVLQAELGDDFEVVGTVICGDNYFGSALDQSQAEVVQMIASFRPDLVVAGPAFNAGRYGVASGTVAKAVQEELGIPAVTGMFAENPGLDMYRKDIFIIQTGDSAAGMRKAMTDIAALGRKLATGAEIGSPEQENYFERGIRVNYFNAVRGSTRAVQMLLAKIQGEPFSTEYPMPKFDRVPPAPPIGDPANVKFAIVTSGGIVPQGNPDRIESSSATKYGVYSLAGLDSMDKKDFMTIHGGYDRAFVTEDPNLVVPLDVLREMERDKEIGGLADFFISTTGTGTSTGNAKRFGEDFSKKLLDENIGAVILTST